MRKLLCVVASACLGLLVAQDALAANHTYYVSASGNDSNAGTSSGSPLKTLEGAHSKITSGSGDNYTIRLMSGSGIYSRGDLGGGYFTWTKSGTFTTPIRITSDSARAEVIGKTWFEGASHIVIDRVDFNAEIDTLRIDESHHITVRHCRFSTRIHAPLVDPNDPDDLDDPNDPEYPRAQGGTIWVGNYDMHNSPSEMAAFARGEDGVASKSIRIVENKFFGDAVDPSSATSKSVHHIYLSQGARNAYVANNTFIRPPGSAVTFNHGWMEHNFVEHNFAYITVNSGIYSAVGLDFGWENANVIADRPSTYANSYKRNHIYRFAQGTIETGNGCPDISTTFHIRSYRGLCESNAWDDNVITYGGEGGGAANTAHDPLWFSFDPSKITTRVVSGDFDGDNKKDDVAAFYHNGSSNSSIHLWERDAAVEGFHYRGVARSLSAFDVSNVDGRMVSGDFNNDGYDDIATFYYYGSGETRIHVFTSDGNDGFSAGSSYWYTPNGYDATKINGRVVAGDFDADGYKDDIAAFYDNGGGSMNIHVWTSTGSALTYHYGSGWFGTSGYDVNKITGRVIAGRFRDDSDNGDDIAVFFENSANDTTIHYFESQPDGGGRKFVYDNESTGWWSSNAFTASKTTGRVVAINLKGVDDDGSGVNDGFEQEIAVIYDNADGTASIYAWKRTAASRGFEPMFPMTTPSEADLIAGPSGILWTGKYDASRAANRVIVGTFDQAVGGLAGEDIVAFYDYVTPGIGSVRTHAWFSLGGGHGQYNLFDQGPVGLPWHQSPAYQP